MEYKLTDHQQEKGNEIISLLKQGHNKIVLKGSAGVGKTTLAKWVAQQLKRDYSLNPNYNNGVIFVTAPTNKALAVLQSKVDIAVEFKTIHSALKMRKWTDDKTGIEVFLKPKYISKDDNFPHCRACILDEASMLSAQFVGGFIPAYNDKNELYQKEVRGWLEDYKFPIIFLGDDKQINPVGEPNTPIFAKDYPTVELTEIIRQGAGNPIIDLSRDLDMIYFKTPNLIDGKGYTYSNARHLLIESLAEVNGTDEMKYLAFTNAEIKSVNDAVRIKRYNKPKKIEKEETIVFNNPHGEYWTNREVKVESVYVCTDYFYIPRSDTKFDDKIEVVKGGLDRIKLKYYRVNDSFNVVHEHSAKMFIEVVNAIQYQCTHNGWGFRGKEFFKSQFADITYNHAITIHKSQGSTYKEVIINIADVNINRNAAEKERLLYTAITRASDLVILNNVK